ncbi:MAG: nucleotide exchange factor GrpE [Deltaproteobacteria bacterium CG11_big_fil_rev_8_21_14_0_20_45_16]|nr:MAG: nucleotide exchange factor GrpE [Deltaproteobacteria bacterium CG11_big_fil_rev_8_21_14_0_20_45_16]
MSKKRGPNPTDDLIDQALRGLDESGEMIQVIIDGQPESNESRSRDCEPQSHGKEAVARIDVQQFVEKEVYMRLAADFDNFRRRALKERKEWERQGQDKVLRELLDILDNFQRGLDQFKSDDGALATGMRMVFSQVEFLIKSQGLERIPTIGTKFDPAFHEAVARIQDPSKENGSIIEELKCGFRWSDRLLRPASVVVIKNEDA